MAWVAQTNDDAMVLVNTDTIDLDTYERVVTKFQEVAQEVGVSLVEIEVQSVNLDFVILHIGDLYTFSSEILRERAGKHGDGWSEEYLNNEKLHTLAVTLVEELENSDDSWVAEPHRLSFDLTQEQVDLLAKSVGLKTSLVTVALDNHYPMLVVYPKHGDYFRCDLRCMVRAGSHDG